MKNSYFTLLLSLCLIPWPGSSVSAQSEALIIVANANVPATQISAREVNEYYLKKKRFWSDGTPVRPLDWSEGQPARRIFLSHVLEKSESDLAQYWMSQKLNTGDQPPMSLDSENSICNTVSALPGSLSYFPASSEILKTCPGIKRLGTLE
jgi:hypothetical protein